MTNRFFHLAAVLPDPAGQVDTGPVGARWVDPQALRCPVERDHAIKWPRRACGQSTAETAQQDKNIDRVEKA